MPSYYKPARPLACPFCAGKQVEIDTFTVSGDDYAVMICQNADCLAEGPRVRAQLSGKGRLRGSNRVSKLVVRSVIRAWNTRRDA